MKRRRHAADQLTLGLPSVGRPWPDHARFPANVDGLEVGPQVCADLLASEGVLIVTGYGSVERLLELFHALQGSTSIPSRKQRRIRVLLGVEPTTAGELEHDGVLAPFERTVVDYWLSRGVSIVQWPALLATLELLDAGRLEVRKSGSRRVHAKVYVGDQTATLGSSNFTDPGLSRNLEANARFTADSEPARYRETADLAENLWTLGSDYTDGFRELLSQLLRKVGWQEALARACAEILEGKWAAGISDLPGRDPDLWPSQRQGIAQALWILENVGSVLIADATGAGKTKMGAQLLRALWERNLRTGRSPGRYPLLVSPPAVKDRWRSELVRAGISVDVHSHGVLSQQRARDREIVERALGQTQLLAVDEAHNFLNRTSTRSRLLYGSGADHVVLLTATPINRGASDLVAIVDMLGADSFDDDILEIVGRLARPRRGVAAMSPAERERVRLALQTFVVRRTKRDFNALIDQEPEAYRNALGQECRFPSHEAITFPREDPESDRAIASAIQAAASKLRGLINLRKLEMPRFLAAVGWTEERYLGMRLKGAQALEAYQLRSRLRSSKAALMEHLIGTEQAVSRLGIHSGKAKPTGDVIGRVARMRGKPPVLKLRLERPAPVWLTDPTEFARAVDEELTIYHEILDLVDGMSDHRVEANASYLLRLLEKHERIIAFDSHLISLHALADRLHGADTGKVAVATGEGNLRSRLAFAERFGLRSSEIGLIGLCSDALAEGLNLQGASAVVHLDLPTVIRVLEQRIGRVDRMDSLHRSVEVHWPLEPKEYQLRADDRLLLRLRDVKDLLGSNVPLPDEWAALESEARTDELHLEDVISAVEEALSDGQGVTLGDAFTRVRSLVSGPGAIVPASTYEQLRDSKARVLASVSVVRAPSNWVFMAVGSADRGVPRWLLADLPHHGEPVIIGTLDGTAEELRSRLRIPPMDIDFDEGAATLLERALRAAARRQRELLPLRKQRALTEMTNVLESYRANSALSQATRTIAGGILQLLESADASGLDVARIADWWLEITRPAWLEHLLQPRVRRPVRLRDLRRRLRAEPLSAERLATVRDVVRQEEPLERRVVAAIVGVAEA